MHTHRVTQTQRANMRGDTLLVHFHGLHCNLLACWAFDGEWMLQAILISFVCFDCFSVLADTLIRMILHVSQAGPSWSD